MGRSGRLRATNDDLIRQLISDPLYRVEADGTVWTLKTRAGKVGKEWRIAGRRETNGYIQVSYQKHRLSVHRIVYQKFNGSLQSDLVVDHDNRIRHDNKPENLKLVTAKTNRQYMERRRREG